MIFRVLYVKFRAIIPRTLLAFLQLSLTWWSHLRSLEIRILISRCRLTDVIWLPSISHWWLWLWHPKCMTVDFKVLKGIIHLSNHHIYIILKLQSQLWLINTFAEFGVICKLGDATRNSGIYVVNVDQKQHRSKHTTLLYAWSDWHTLGACLTNAYMLSTSLKPGTNPVLEIASDSQRCHFEHELLMCHFVKRFLEIEVYQIHGFALIVFLVDLAEKLQGVGQTASTFTETMLRRKDELVMLQVIYELVADYPFHRFAYYRCQTYRSIIVSDLTPTFLVNPCHVSNLPLIRNLHSCHWSSENVSKAGWQTSF